MAIDYRNFDEIRSRDDEAALIEDRGFFSYFSKDDLIFAAILILFLEAAILMLINIW